MQSKSSKIIITTVKIKNNISEITYLKERGIVMPVKVRIPTPLRSLTNGEDEVTVEGKSIKEVIDNLETNYSGFKERLCDENGKIRRFINFYLNDEDIRFKDNQDTPVSDGDQISIIPAIAGGVS